VGRAVGAEKKIQLRNLLQRIGINLETAIEMNREIRGTREKKGAKREFSLAKSLPPLSE
jgi:hypothetical protein